MRLWGIGRGRGRDRGLDGSNDIEKRAVARSNNDKASLSSINRTLAIVTFELATECRIESPDKGNQRLQEGTRETCEGGGEQVTVG